jgi:hypothetical protein
VPCDGIFIGRRAGGASHVVVNSGCQGGVLEICRRYVVAPCGASVRPKLSNIHSTISEILRPVSDVAVFDVV